MPRRAIAIGRRGETLTDATRTPDLHDVDCRRDRIMAVVADGEPGRVLHKHMLVNRTHLFVFMLRQAAPYTNAAHKRHMLPSVIFRKVTKGSRCQCGGGDIMLPSVSPSVPRQPMVPRCLIATGL